MRWRRYTRTSHCASSVTCGRTGWCCRELFSTAREGGELGIWDLTNKPLRTAEVIAIGSELLGSTRLDTNSLYIAERLSAIGVELRSKTVVGDDRELIAGLARQALERADLVVVT